MNTQYTHQTNRVTARRENNISRSLVFPFLAGAAALLLITNSLNATPVVSWGGNTVTNQVNLVLPTPTDTGATRTWEYDFDTPLLQTSEAYSGLPIYGALQNISGQASPANFSVARIENSGTNDVIRIRGNNNLTGETNIISGLIFFKPELESGQTISFATGGSMTLAANTSGTSPRRVRMAVLNDGIWYLSATENQAGFAIANTATELWGTWGPTGAPLSSAPIVFNITGLTFTNIEAVGVWFNLGRPNVGGGEQGRLDISSFLVDATVIPEPSVAALLFLAAFGIVFGRSAFRKTARSLRSK